MGDKNYTPWMLAKMSDPREIIRELRKAAYDKADAHNSSAPLGVDSMAQEDTLYWRAADEIVRLHQLIGTI